MPGIAGSASCQHHHIGFAVSGTLHVVADSGQELDVSGQSVYEIPPGHDAWVIGDEAWRQRLAVHHLRMRDHLNVFRGREVKTTGDGLLAVFDRPAKAVRCAAAMAATARAMDLPIRAGVHTGEVEFMGDDARGLAVHTAARVMSLGEADDVMVSTTTRELLEGSGIALEDAGEHELKGLPGVRRVFRLERQSDEDYTRRVDGESRSPIPNTISQTDQAR